MLGCQALTGDEFSSYIDHEAVPRTEVRSTCIPIAHVAVEPLAVCHAARGFGPPAGYPWSTYSEVLTAVKISSRPRPDFNLRCFDFRFASFKFSRGAPLKQISNRNGVLLLLLTVDRLPCCTLSVAAGGASCLARHGRSTRELRMRASCASSAGCQWQ